jgi:hypothetical protein
MTMVARLQLPNTNCHLYSMTFRSPPAKNGIPRNNQFINAAVSNKPFTNSPDNIICCSMTVENPEEFGRVSLIVHSSTLLRYATPQDFKIIGWDEWNSMARCANDWKSRATTFSGQRWLVGNEIRDFNQYRVKRLGRDFSTGTKTARTSVITTASSIEALTNYTPFDSGTLPFVRIVKNYLHDGRIFSVSIYRSLSLILCPDVIIMAVHA